MAEPHVISALVRKRAELSGEIEAAEEHLSVLQQRLQHVDGALSVFGYEAARPIKPIRRQRPTLFQKGELVRFILHALRNHGPQSVADLSNAVMGDKGFPREEHRTIHRKVVKALERQKMRGTVQAGRGADHVWRWSVVQR